MNPVEIEEAISALAEQPFDPEKSPFPFLEAFSAPSHMTYLDVMFHEIVAIHRKLLLEMASCPEECYS